MEQSTQSTETIGTRLGKFLTSQGISFYAFEKRTGFPHGLIGKIVKKGTDFGVGKLETIFACYPEINPVWLTTGTGNMLLKEPNQASKSQIEQFMFAHSAFADKYSGAGQVNEPGPETDQAFIPPRTEAEYTREYGFTDGDAKNFLNNVSNILKSGQFVIIFERLVVFVENNTSLSDADKYKIIRPLYELRALLVHSVNQVTASEAKYLGALDAIKLLAGQLRAASGSSSTADQREQQSA